jgi:hypothetical protein
MPNLTTSCGSIVTRSVTEDGVTQFSTAKEGCAKAIYTPKCVCKEGLVYVADGNAGSGLGAAKSSRQLAMGACITMLVSGPQVH